MSTTSSVPISQLLLDGSNPRLHQSFADQRAILEAMLGDKDLRPKIITLAEDIAKHGLNPADLLLATPEGAPDEDRYIVVDGNRRLVALMLLLKPHLGDEVLSVGAVAKIRGHSAQMTASITTASVVIVATRTDADHWIALRHGIGLDGAGIIRWDSLAARRWDTRHQAAGSFASQVVAFLEQMGVMPDWFKATPGQFPLTNLERMLIGHENRLRFGLSQDAEGKLLLHYRPEVIAKTFRKLIDDLTAPDRNNRLTVSSIKQKGQRDQYIADELTLPSQKAKLPVPISAAAVPSSAVPTTSTGATRGQQQRGKHSPPLRVQKTLFRKDVALRIDVQRVSDILDELQRLPVAEYPNTVGVMLRIFIELSVDAYIDRHTLMTKQERYARRVLLHEKVLKVANHLVSTGIMHKKDLTPLNQLKKSGKLFDPGVELLNAYVHHLSVTPQGADLKALASDLLPFFRALWP